MKRLSLFLIALFLFFDNYSQNIGIGTTSPQASAILDIVSTTQGLLIPRMKETERLALSTPAEGLTVYQTDNKSGLYYYDGTNWLFVGNKTYEAWVKSGIYTYTKYADKVGVGTQLPDLQADVRGFVYGHNYFTAIPLWKAGEITLNNSTSTDVVNCETGIIPTIFAPDGQIEVKLVIRSTDRNGLNHFQLRVHNGTTELYPIVASDAWTWAYTQNGTTVTSPWKVWDGGTTAWEVHLQEYSENSGDYVTINAVYLLVRPAQK